MLGIGRVVLGRGGRGQRGGRAVGDAPVAVGLDVDPRHSRVRAPPGAPLVSNSKSS